MNEKSNFFLGKKILIYGLGKSGISVFNFLKRFNKIFLFDDDKKICDNKLKDIEMQIKKIMIEDNKVTKEDF